MIDTSKIDDDILQEIIELCEKAMIQPLSKKKAVKPEVAAVEEEEEEGLELAGDEPEEGGDDTSEEDLDAMLEEYNKKKIG